MLILIRNVWDYYGFLKNSITAKLFWHVNFSMINVKMYSFSNALLFI